jgi:hypothetical protein
MFKKFLKSLFTPGKPNNLYAQSIIHPPAPDELVDLLNPSNPEKTYYNPALNSLIKRIKLTHEIVNPYVEENEKLRLAIEEIYDSLFFNETESNIYSIEEIKNKIVEKINYLNNKLNNRI